MKTTITEPKLNVSLTGEEISNIMKVGESNQACKENTTKFIQSHTMDRLKINPTTNKTQPMPNPTDMEIIVEPLTQ